MKIHNRFPIILFAGIAALFAMSSISGCAKKIIHEDAVIRYQSVSIPSYDKPDYELQLESKNDEVKYNAICNLIPDAPEYAKVLSRGLSEKASPDDASTDDASPDDASPDDASPDDDSENRNKHNTAMRVFNTILEGLESGNNGIKAASLIFIQEFHSKYERKEELRGPVLKIKTRNFKVQYEQLRTLILMSDSLQSVDSDLINGFLNSRSWLIRSMAYRLLSNLDSFDFQERLVKEYGNTKEEFDKLLIIQAFRKGYGEPAFGLFKGELASSKNKMIRNAIADILKKHKDNTAVIDWIIDMNRNMDDETLERIFQSYLADIIDPGGAGFFEQMIRSGQERLMGFIDREKLFFWLFLALQAPENPKDLADLRMAVENSQSLKPAWLEYKDKALKEQLLEKEKKEKDEQIKKTALPKYILLMEKFLEDTKNLLSESGMEAGEIEKSTEVIRNMIEDVIKEREE